MLLLSTPSTFHCSLRFLCCAYVLGIQLICFSCLVTGGKFWCFTFKYALIVDIRVVIVLNHLVSLSPPINMQPCNTIYQVSVSFFFPLLWFPLLPFFFHTIYISLLIASDWKFDPMIYWTLASLSYACSSFYSPNSWIFR